MKRGGVGDFTKFPEKVPKVVVAAFQADLRDREVGLLEQAEGLLDAVLVDIFDRGAPDDLFKKTAEILFVHAGLLRQVVDVDFFLIILTDVGQCFFDHLHPFVMVFLHGGEEAVAGKYGQDAEQGGLDVQLVGQVVGHGAVALGQVCGERAEGLHDLCKCGVNGGKCGVVGKKEAGEAYLPVLHGLDQLHLRGVVGVKAEDAGGKDDGILPEAAGLLGDDAVELAGVDEVQAFGADGKLLHVDLQAELPAGKIQDLDLVVPVVLDEDAFAHGAGLIDGTGKGFGAVGADFLQGG